MTVLNMQVFKCFLTTKCCNVLLTGLLNVCLKPQPAAAPVAPAPAEPGAFGCPGTPPASGTSGHTGSGNLSSTRQSPSPLTEHTTHHKQCN